MRRFYRSRRNNILEMLQTSPFAAKLTIREEDAGLHFLVKVDTQFSDDELVALCAQAGIPAAALSSFYHTPVPAEVAHTLVINYAVLKEEQLEVALQRIPDLM
jgi:GntR family transcriptional regulator/MocR family aminotransferase